MFPFLHGWASEAEPLEGKGLVWVPFGWPSSYDFIFGDTAQDLTPAGDAGETIHPTNDDDRVADLWTGYIEELYRNLEIDDLSSIVLVLTQDTLYVIAPQDGDELVRGLWDEAQSWFDQDDKVWEELNTLEHSSWSVWPIVPRDILSEIQYHLLEPVKDGGVTWQFWNAGNVRNYLLERVARWLVETKAVRERKVVTVVEKSGTYSLDTTLAALHRVYFNRRLHRVDKWALDKAEPDWETAEGTPRQFVETRGRGRTQVILSPIPGPGQSGSASYIMVPRPPEAYNPAIPPLPATFSWGIKYGVMADMLATEGEGNDPVRAEYCETRFNDAVALAKLMRGVELAE